MESSNLIILSGPSGIGKSTILHKISENEVKSSTTRGIRTHEGEIDGVQYYFTPRKRFIEMIHNHELAEWNEYLGEYYGISKKEIDLRLSKGNAFCIVEANGMKKLKSLYPNAVSIFIHASYEEAKAHLESRGENNETVQKRLKNYEKEMATRGLYDYVIHNKHGKLDETVELVKKIIEIES